MDSRLELVKKCHYYRPLEIFITYRNSGLPMSLKRFLPSASLLASLLVLAGCQSMPKERSAQVPAAKPALSSGFERLTRPNYSPAAPGRLPDLLNAQSLPEPDTEDSPAESPIFHQNLWRYIADNLQLNDLDNPRIQNEISWFTDHPRYIEVSAERASPYLYFIVEQLEAKEIPLDLALVPMIESSFNPFANSPAQAAGIWQIIPGTGRRFGLEQNFWYDGRRDIKEATRAALEYLTYLSSRYNGDWLLALAAYNSGEGTVDRAINENLRKGLATDYWSLRLPRETMAYVPKILALGKLLGNPQQYGLNSPDLPNQPYLETVDINQQINLAYAAELANMDFSQLKRLNPGFNRDATSPNGTHYLLLPKQNAMQLREQMDTLMDKGRVSWLQYKTRAGDTLKELAAFYEVSAEQIQQLNRIKSKKLKTGDTLLIPVAASSAEHFQQKLTRQLAMEAEAALKAKQRSEPVSRNQTAQIKTHKVSSGDSLWQISQRYKVSVEQLARLNQLKPGADLKPGQQLRIQQTASNDKGPASSRPLPKSRTSPSLTKTYKVAKGESLSVISSKLNVDIDDLKRWNKLGNGHKLKQGQQLSYQKPKG